MKRFTALASALVLVLAALTTFGGTANAAPNCQHYTDGEIVSAAHVRVGGTGTPIGAIQLCKTGSYYWAFMVLYDPMPAGYWGTAWFWRLRGDAVIATWTCGSLPQGAPNGGNGHIIVNQTMCWTAKIYGGGSTDVFEAEGVVYRGSDAFYAWGLTAATR